MPISGPYGKGAQNGAKFGDEFDYEDIIAGKVAFAAATSSTATVTHGLTGTPDFIIGKSSLAEDISHTANSTSVTFVRATTGAATISYIIGDLA